MEKDDLYLRMRYEIDANVGDTITIGDVCQFIETDEKKYPDLIQLPIHHVTKEDESVVIVDVLQVIKKIRTYDPHITIRTIGSPETIVAIVEPKRHAPFLYFAFVWLLLFIGAGLAIMNFHEDVSMKAVHIRMFELVTGNKVEKPLLLQIPYSIGLGVGMVLFFNHFFKKRLSDEPSPLEIEMFHYEQSIDQYVITHERKDRHTNSTT